jgi:hypothetical protein
MPLKGHTNMIRIDREIYLKHTLTDLETLNEPSSIDFPVLSNYSCDSYFGNFSPLSSDVPLTQNSKMIFQKELLEMMGETIELIGGKEEVIGKKKMINFSHKFGPCTSMALNRKKGLGQGATSLIQKVNNILYHVDLSLNSQTIPSSTKL